jgi:hypothetical protein
MDLEQWITYAASYYGIDPDFEPNSSPLTAEELEDNIRWCFFTGNYGLNFTYATRAEAMTARDNMDLRAMCLRYPELMGFYANSDYLLTITRQADKTWLLNITVQNAPISPEELFEQQKEALDAAISFRNKLYSSRKITSGMTQKQIVQVYYNELNKLQVQTSSTSSHEKNRQIYMQYDSAYATIIGKKADCVGRAALFQLMMNLEGIPAGCVSGNFNTSSTGHVVNLVVADGTEYVCDWGNRYPLQSADSFSRRFTFDRSLQTVRAALES